MIQYNQHAELEFDVIIGDLQLTIDIEVFDDSAGYYDFIINGAYDQDGLDYLPVLTDAEIRAIQDAAIDKAVEVWENERTHHDVRNLRRHSA